MDARFWGDKDHPKDPVFIGAYRNGVFQIFLGLIKCSGQCVFCHRHLLPYAGIPFCFFTILEFLCVDSWVFKQRKIPVDNSEWHRHRNERTAGCNQIHHDQCGLKEYFCFVYNISCLHGHCKYFPELRTLFGFMKQIFIWLVQFQSSSRRGRG